MRIEFVIAGTGRSRTAFAAPIFTAVGLHCTHEAGSSVSGHIPSGAGRDFAVVGSSRRAGR